MDNQWHEILREVTDTFSYAAEFTRTATTQVVLLVPYEVAVILSVRPWRSLAVLFANGVRQPLLLR